MLVLPAVAPLSATTLFRAELTPKQVVPKNGAPSPAGVSKASATATFELFQNGGDPYLEYEIQFDQINLIDDITGIHFHIGYTPPPAASSLILGATPRHSAPGQENGPHTLNVYGLPRQDDADLAVSPDGTWLRGRWGNEDVNYGSNGTYDPSDSVGLGSVYTELFEGDIYIQVHSHAFNVPDTGELRGQILPVPEPGVASVIPFALVMVLSRRRAYRRT
ncbi:MAG: CHRD domain-containing protein [Verrucomicrobiaceae bacterium]